MTERLPLNSTHNDHLESPDPLITVHRRNTVVGSVCASALTSALALGAHMSGHPIEGLPTVNLSYTHTTDALAHQKSTTWRNEAELVDQTTEASNTLVPSSESHTLSFTIKMPDVSSMDLLKDPAAQKIVNEDELHNRTILLKQEGLQGWEITDVAIHGKSSDEMSSSPNSGIGHEDPQMGPLAAQYGQFARNRLVDEFTAEGIPLKDDVLTVTSGEAILDTEAQLHWNAVREAAGYTSNEAFIKEYKTNPGSMPGQARAALKAYLDNNRGANVTIALSRPTTKEVPVTKTTSVTRCVDITIVDQITTPVDNKHGGNLPFFPVLLPMFKIRRPKEENVAGTVPNTDPALTATSETAPTDAPTPVAREITVGQSSEGEGVGTGSGTNLTEQTEGGRHRYIGRPTSRIKRQLTGDGGPQEDYHDKWFASYNASRRRRRNGWIAAGLGATLLSGALYMTTNLDAGYCPDPEKYADQPFDIHKGPPETIHVSLENPLTGDRTRSWLVFAANACGNMATQQTAVRQTDPNSSLPLTNTCDTRTLYYRNNVLIDVDESVPNPNSTYTKVIVSE